MRVDPVWSVVRSGNVVSWELLAIGFATAAAVLAILAIWQLAARLRVRRRFAGIVEVDHEIAARRQAFHVERTGAQRAFEAESAGRRRAVDAELAEHAAELQVARGRATCELAEMVRAASEIYEHHASARAALGAELTALQAKIAEIRADPTHAQARRNDLADRHDPRAYRQVEPAAPCLQDREARDVEPDPENVAIILDPDRVAGQVAAFDEAWASATPILGGE